MNTASLFSGVQLSLSDLIKLETFANLIQFRETRFTGNQQAGIHASHIKGKGMDFAEVRNYQAGDEIRNVDWRVTARTGKVHTKLFTEEKDKSVFCVIDLSDTMYFGSQVTFKATLAMRIATILAFAANLKHYPFGLLLLQNDTSVFLPAKIGKQALIRALKIMLNLYEKKSEDTNLCQSLNISLKQFGNIKAGNLIYVFSDFYDFQQSAIKSVLQSVGMGNQIHLMHIFDTLEANLPKPNVYSIKAMDESTKEALSFDSTNKKIVSLYQKYFEDHVETLKHFCHQQGMALHNVMTSTDILHTLKRGFF